MNSISNKGSVESYRISNLTAQKASISRYTENTAAFHDL